MVTSTVHLPSTYYFRRPAENVVEIAVDDADITVPATVEVTIDPPQPENFGTYITYSGNKVIVRSHEGDYGSILPTDPFVRLLRDDVCDYWRPANIPAEYSIDVGGAATCIGVTRESMEIIDTYHGESATSSQKACQRRHYVRFHFDAALPVETRVQISHSAGALPSIDETINDKTDLCPGLHVNCFGKSPFLQSKGFTLSEILYGMGSNANGLGGDTADIVDYSAYTSFYIIDANTGAVVSDLYPIIKTFDETDQILGNANEVRASSTRHWPITNITQAASAVIRIDEQYLDVDLQVDDEIYIGYVDLDGMREINWWGYGAVPTVTALNDNGNGTWDVTTDINSSGYTAYTSGGHLYATQTRNRAGTKVFSGDFSLWEPPYLGSFRVWIPNLGVSRAFQCDPAADKLVAKYTLGAVFDLHNGYAHNGEYSKTRARAFHNLTTYLSYGISGYGVGQGGGAQAGYATTTPVSGLEHVYPCPDAGDWDCYIGHLPWEQRLLRLQQVVSDTAWRSDFGHPGALTKFNENGDTAASAFWAGTENLPDSVQAFIICLQHFRALRVAAGDVYSGWTEATGQCDFNFVPTFKANQPKSVYSPSPQSCWIYAAAAADLAVLLYGEGLTTLAQTLCDEAETSYDRALEIISNETSTPGSEYAGLADVIFFNMTLSTAVSVDDVITDATTGATAVALEDVSTGGNKTVRCNNYDRFGGTTFGEGNTLNVSGSPIGSGMTIVDQYSNYMDTGSGKILDSNQDDRMIAALHLWRCAVAGLTTSNTQQSYLDTVEGIGPDVDYFDTLALYDLTSDANKTLGKHTGTILATTVTDYVDGSPYPTAVYGNGFYGSSFPVNNARNVLGQVMVARGAELETMKLKMARCLDHALGEQPKGISYLSQIGEESEYASGGTINTDDWWDYSDIIRGIGAFVYLGSPNSGSLAFVYGTADPFWDFVADAMYQFDTDYNRSKMMEPFPPQLAMYEYNNRNGQLIIGREHAGEPEACLKHCWAMIVYDAGLRYGAEPKGSLGQYIWARSTS